MSTTATAVTAATAAEAVAMAGAVTVATAASPVATGGLMAMAAPAGMAAATRAAAGDRADTFRLVAGPRVWSVWDRDDEAACVQALLGLDDLEAGRVVCHPRPGASWPVLVEDLLRALGKHPQALSRERRSADGRRLLRVWLRAEHVRHLVVLRAHRLGPIPLARLVELAAAAELALWLVWHHHEPPPHHALRWSDAVAALSTEHHPTPGQRDVYGEAFAAARAEARTWRPDGHRLGPTVRAWNHAWPGCDVAALLQRLTIDAADPAELRTRLRAARDGFPAEGRRLTLPDLGPDALAVLGPRLSPATVQRLRRLVCPATATAVMLGLATDAEAPFLARTLFAAACGADQVTLLAGTYRIPVRARPLLRAAILAHDPPGPAQSLLARPGTGVTSPQCVAHLVRRV